MTTIILGGGIIGLSTAYYLSLSSPQSKIYILDSSPELLASASGFAGGFLAENWFSSPVASLGALSFRLHRELAAKHGGRRRWGYAGSHVFSLSVDERSVGAKEKGRDGKGESAGEDWISEGTSRAEVAPRSSEASVPVNTSGSEREEILNPDGSPAVWTPQVGGTLETISSSEECAQIEPRELCEFLLEECKKRGVEVLLSTRATGILTNSDGTLRGLKLESTGTKQDEQELDSKNVVISAGAWTPRVFATLFSKSEFRVPIEPLAGHSIVVKSPRYKTPFTSPGTRSVDAGGGDENWMCYSICCTPGRHWSYAPEAFARLARNGETEVWVGGLNDSSLQLPDLSTDVKGMIDRASIKDLRRGTVQLAGLAKEGDEVNQDDLETIRESLCFRPVSQRGTPLIGKIPDRYLGGVKVSDDGGGVWIASGHGPWGISLSLGTGKVMSEMVMGRETSADVRTLRVD